MTIFFIAIAAVIVLWLITQVIQKAEKRSREKLIEKHIEEKKKEEEAESKSPLGSEEKEEK